MLRMILKCSRSNQVLQNNFGSLLISSDVRAMSEHIIFESVAIFTLCLWCRLVWGVGQKSPTASLTSSLLIFFRKQHRVINAKNLNAFTCSMVLNFYSGDWTTSCLSLKLNFSPFICLIQIMNFVKHSNYDIPGGAVVHANNTT